MKTFKLINILLSLLLTVFLFNRCTDDFEEININKRVLSELDAATVGNVFAHGQWYSQIGSDIWASWQISENLFADLYVQYYACTAQYFQTDRHNTQADWSDSHWNFFYDAERDFEVVLENTRAQQMWKHYAIQQIFKVFAFQRETDFWGPIPYSKVNNQEKTVPYDSQEDIYRSFLVQLDSATTLLNDYRGENAFGTNDLVYAGDVDKWITFANSLRLRIAMRMSYVDPTTAKTEAEKAVAAGVMETNAQNAFLAATSKNYNPLGVMCPWNEFRMSATMESLLKGFDDPRLEAYWSPAAASGEFKGMRNGVNNAEMSTAERHVSMLSTLHPRWSDNGNKDKTPWQLMYASECWLLRAEGALNGWNMGAGVTAQSAYEKGIETSLSQWGATPDQIAAYIAGTTTPIALPDFNTPPLSDITVAWMADDSRHLEQIMTQKYLAVFPDGWEAWSETRRTEFPKLYPVVHSDNPDVPPDQQMRRVPFQVTEYNNNKDAVEAAKSLLGGPDNAATRLWWNPAK